VDDPDEFVVDVADVDADRDERSTRPGVGVASTPASAAAGSKSGRAGDRIA
jgi:hypothetical protein